MSQLQAPPVERTRLANGLQVVVAPRRGVPLVAVRLLVRAGSALDPTRRFGLAHLVAAAVRRGTRRRSGPRLDSEVESLGAELGGGVDEDAAGLGLSAPLEALPRLLDVVADVAMRPSFPPAEVERLRRREVASLAHDLDEPGVVADRATLMAAYGTHAYGHPSEGRGRDVAAARRSDLATFHARHWRPSRATLLVVGPVDTGRTLALAVKRFGGWKGAPGAELEIVAPAPPGGPSVLIVDRPELTQAQVRIVSGGYPRASPDYTAGLVAGAVLGGGFTSRLMEAVRVNRGLSYGVRSRFATSRAGGLFFVSSFTKVETAGELVQVALDEVARFREGGATEEELERTRGYLCGLYPLGLETHEQWAEKLAEVELFGLAGDEVSGYLDRVRAVDAAACLEVARRWLPVDGRVVVVAVGPARRLQAQLARFGPVKVVAARTVM
jgi:zinc protease